MKLAKQDEFPQTWNELFEDSLTEWFETELDYSTDFINKIFDSGQGFMTHIGLKHSELVRQYLSGKMPKEHSVKIDAIRKNLKTHPRIIVLTADFNEFSILDGARRTVAFILEKKPIPVYIGRRDEFSSLPNFGKN
ncbi:MAG: hypothetical protein ACMXYF_01200 [Candidatus Woesearchaeota archaeon]